jgi:hypothetical protein
MGMEGRPRRLCALMPSAGSTGLAGEQRWRPPGQQITVRAQADGGKTFKQGTAVVTAFVDGCNNVTCGSESDSEVIDIKR